MAWSYQRRLSTGSPSARAIAPRQHRGVGRVGADPLGLQRRLTRRLVVGAIEQRPRRDRGGPRNGWSRRSRSRRGLPVADRHGPLRIARRARVRTTLARTRSPRTHGRLPGPVDAAGVCSPAMSRLPAPIATGSAGPPQVARRSARTGAPSHRGRGRRARRLSRIAGRRSGRDRRRAPSIPAASTRPSRASGTRCRLLTRRTRPGSPSSKRPIVCSPAIRRSTSGWRRNS